MDKKLNSIINELTIRTHKVPKEFVLDPDLDFTEIFKEGLIKSNEFDFKAGFDKVVALDKDGKYIRKIGNYWKEFDFKKGLNALIKIGNPGSIYNAGKDWKKFDFNRGFDALVKIGNPESIYNAGNNWKEFDFKKGFDALIEKDKTGEWVCLAGKGWKQFDYEKGFDVLIKADKTGQWIYYAGSDWSKFDYERGFDALIKADKTGQWIYYAGKDWKKFDFNIGFDALIEVDKYGEWVYNAGRHWKEFDYEKGLEYLKSKHNLSYYDNATAKGGWPLSAKEALSSIKERPNGNKKIPNKKLVLESNKDSPLARVIHSDGVYKSKTFDYKKGFEDLLNSDDDGLYMAFAGRDWKWKEFDYKRALDRIIELDDDGSILSLLGEYWGKKLNHEKALDALIKVDKIGEWILYAGENWPEFNYKKAIDALDKIEDSGQLLHLAFIDWKVLEKRDKTIAERILDILRNKKSKFFYKSLAADYGLTAKQVLKDIDHKETKKIPNKKLVLEDRKIPKTEGEIKAMKVRIQGEEFPESFDFKKGFEDLIKFDTGGFEIYLAGRRWKEFDYERGLEALINVDEFGYNILEAGFDWKQFDFEKGQDAIIYVDDSGDVIYEAGKGWKQFDYGKGLEALNKVDTYGENIFKAGIRWKKFDHKKGLKYLDTDKRKRYYELAKKHWPKNAEEALLDMKKELKGKKKIPNKKMVLESIDRKDLLSRATYSMGREISTIFDFKKGFEVLIKNDETGEWIYRSGDTWKIFDYERGLDALTKADKTGEWIYRSGIYWKEFDFEKGLDALTKADKTGEWIYYAGIYWKEFDFEKGLDALLKIDRYGEWISKSGVKWKKFDFKKGLDALNKKDVTGEWTRLAGERWKFSAKEAIKFINNKKRSNKIPNKKLVLENSTRDESDIKAEEICRMGLDPSDKFDHKKGLDDLIKYDTTGFWIYRAGIGWDSFDYEKALDAIIEKDKEGNNILYAGVHWDEFNFKKGLDALIKIDKTGQLIYWAGDEWDWFKRKHMIKNEKGPDYKKALRVLKKLSPDGFYKEALKKWPLSAKEAMVAMGNNKKPKKIPNKKMVLENEEEEEGVYKAGTNNSKDFNFEKEFEHLIKSDNLGHWIYGAGVDWPKFDYERGLDALIEKAKTGTWIYYAGRDWKEFDFKKGFDALVKVDKAGMSIYEAGRHWKEFDYDKGLEVLKIKSPDKYYKKADLYWPKNAEEALLAMKKELQGKKIPNKKMVLENTEGLGPKEIYFRGTEKPDFDFDKGLDDLIKADSTGEWIYLAGKHWKKFDFNKGLDALIEADEGGEWIYLAGKHWKKFDYDKGLEALLKTDKTGEQVYKAGLQWKEFDFKRGFDVLIKIDKVGEWIYWAGINWKKFDHSKGLEHLEKTSKEYYELALDEWPMTAIEVLSLMKNKSQSKKIPNKKMVLENAEEARSIYYQGRNFPNKAEELLDDLAKADITGEWIYKAGMYWKQFDFKKGLDALIEKDKKGFYIYRAGLDWKEFNFKKSFNALAEIDKDGLWIYRAGAHWSEFDYEKGLDVLSKISPRVGGIEKLIYSAGVDWKEFNYDKGLDALIKTDRFGEWIYKAGRHWKNFDHGKGLDALIKLSPMESEIERWIFLAGLDWKQFNYDKGLDILKKISPNEYYEQALEEWKLSAKATINHIKKSSKNNKKIPNKKLVLENTENLAGTIFNMGLWNLKKEFDYEKGLKDLIMLDKEGQWVYYAGRDWPKFDYKKGFEALLKADKEGRLVFLAGRDWRKIDYAKGLRFLKKKSPKEYYKLALDNWPLSAEEALTLMKKELQGEKKIPNKKKILEYYYNPDYIHKDMKADAVIKAWEEHPDRFDFEKGLDDLIRIGSADWISIAEGKWKEFDHKKAFNAILKLDDTGENVYWAGIDWRQFDHKKGLEWLKKKNRKFYKRALREWPMNAEQTIDKIDNLSKSSKKIPNKKLVLEGKDDLARFTYFQGRSYPNRFVELLVDLSKYDNTGEWTYEAGKDWKFFDFKKGFEVLVKADRTGKWIHLAGNNWKKFDLKKGLDALIEADKFGEWIYWAGRSWKKFDYKKGFDAIIKKDEFGKWIFLAGRGWPKFDYKKGLEHLKKISPYKYHGLALDEWPKNAVEVLDSMKNKPQGKKIPNKKLVLENISNSEAKIIYNNGKDNPNTFDFDKGLDELIKADEKGAWIYFAGIDWEKFDFDKGLEALGNKKGSGSYIYSAGVHWDKFDSNKGLDALIKVDDTGEWIYKAGTDWEQFDYKKGFDALAEIDKYGKWLCLAGKQWIRFNHKKGLEILKSKNKKCYDIALKSWPPSAKEVLSSMKKELKGKKIPNKKLVLETTETLKKAKQIYRNCNNWEAFDRDKALEELIKYDNDGLYIFRAGRNWSRVDHEKALDGLIKNAATPEYVVEAGREWSKFNFEKAYKYLVNLKDNGFALSNAGRYWKEFDHKKAFEDLVRIDRTGLGVYSAGRYWKEFDHKKGLEVLRNKSDKYYNLALGEWGLSAKETIDAIDTNKNKKIPNKKMMLEDTSDSARSIYSQGKNYPDTFDFEKGIDDLIKADEDGYYIYLAGKDWKVFDFKKGFEALLNLKEDRKVELMYWAGKSWKEFDYAKALEFYVSKETRGWKWNLNKIKKGWRFENIIKGLQYLENNNKELYTKAAQIFGLSAKDVLNDIGKELQGKKIPNKKLVLESVAYKAEMLYREGNNSPRTFDFEKGLERLIKIDEKGQWLFNAGASWKQFDFKKGFDALAKADKTGKWIHLAGKEWKQFDFEKGFDALTKVDKTGEWIYWAGRSWKRFDREKGLKILRNPLSKFYYKEALTNWKFSAKEVVSMIDAKNKNKKIPNKKLVLEAAPNKSLMSLYAEGKNNPDFDYEKGLDKLIKLDSGGTFIQWAGAEWPEFNYKKGSEAILKSGLAWDLIYQAGLEWKDFDYGKGIEFYMKRDPHGIELNKIKKNWKPENIAKGLRYLKDNSEKLYSKATSFFGLSAEETLSKMKKELQGKKTKKIPNKKMILEAKRVGIAEKTVEEGKNNPDTFDFENGFKVLLQRDTTGQWFCEAGRYWKEFDYKKGFDALIKRAKKGTWIYDAGRYWKEFDYEKALDVLINRESIDVHWIYAAGTFWKQFDFEKGLDGVIKKDVTGQYMYYAGRDWMPEKMLDYEKLLDALIEKDKTGKYIELSGEGWRRFNYKKGLDALLEKDKTGEYIYYAGERWKRFDYVRALSVLKDIGGIYYRKAKVFLPLTAKDALAFMDKEKQSNPSKKIPNKKLVLEGIEDLEAERIFREGKNRPNKFDFEKGLDDLIKIDKTVIWIYKAGKYWKRFDYEKGFNVIVERDKIGEWICKAGSHWKQFDFKKGFDALIKTDKTGEWIYWAGRYWKQFDYERGFDALIEKDKTGEWIAKSGRVWKRFSFKKAFDALIEKDNTGQWITTAGEGWERFNYEKGLDALLEIDKSGKWISLAGERWKLSAKEVVRFVDSKKKPKKIPNKSLVLEDTENSEAERIANKGKRASKRGFDYEKALDDLIEKDKTGRWIYMAGLDWKIFNYNKALDALIKADKTGKYIYHAGGHGGWKELDYKKALDALIEIDKTGKWIYYAGKDWKEFDYKKGFDTLVRLDKVGKWVVLAGRLWKRFDHVKGLEGLKKINNKEHLEVAFNKWKLTAKQAVSAIDGKASKKIPNKKLVLESKEKRVPALVSSYSEEAKAIYLDGKVFPNDFDYKQGFEKLLKADKAGNWIVSAGIYWKEFDYEKGLDALIEIKEDGSNIYYAGRYWKEFDYERGLDALIKLGKAENFLTWAGVDWKEFDYEKAFGALINGEHNKKSYRIYFAGNNWGKFDYKKGLEVLIKEDKTGEFIYEAGKNWKEFDFKKGLEALKSKKAKYYNLAKNDWPPSAEETLIKMKKELKNKTTKKIPNKKLVLEDTENLEAKKIYEEGKKKPVGFDFEKGLADLIKIDMTGKWIYRAGNYWRKFDYEKAFNVLIKRDKVGEWICNAGIYWKRFDYEKGSDVLIKRDKVGRWIYYAGKDWKQFDYKKGFDALLKKDKTGEWIAKSGEMWKRFSFKKAFDALIEKDNVGQWIAAAGCVWKRFNYEKGLDALLEIDKSGRWIILAGRCWKQFDYEKGLRFFKETNNEAFLRYAFDNWKITAKQAISSFDDNPFKPKKIPNKKMVLESKMIPPEEKKASKVLARGIKYPNSFNFEKGVNSLLKFDNQFLDYTIEAGKKWKEFDYDKAIKAAASKKDYGSIIFKMGIEWEDKVSQEKLLDILISLSDENCELINRAGKHWKAFNYEKALDAIIKRDNTGFWILKSGDEWKHFNFKKAFDALIKKDNIGQWIAAAGFLWKEFDYERGFDALIEVDKTGKFIYEAGGGNKERFSSTKRRIWKRFDYKKGLKVLKKISKEYYDLAKKDWPLSAKETIAVIDNKPKNVKKISNKKMVLEWTSSEAEQILKDEEENPNFNYKKGFDDLMRIDKEGEYILKAGKDWKQFDYEEGLVNLIKRDNYGGLVYRAGLWWPKFDFDKGLDHLIKVDITGKYLYETGKTWKQADYIKALKAMKDMNSKYYYFAKKQWAREKVKPFEKFLRELKKN